MNIKIERLESTFVKEISYILMEEIKDEDGYYIEKVIDSDLILELSKLFKEQL